MPPECSWLPCRYAWESPSPPAFRRAGIITGIVGGLLVGTISGSPMQGERLAAGLAVIVFQLVKLLGRGNADHTHHKPLAPIQIRQRIFDFPGSWGREPGRFDKILR